MSFRFVLLLLALVDSSIAYAPLQGVKVTSLASGKSVDLGEYLSSPTDAGSRSMLVLGTYAADFNAIEYAQRLRYYTPKLRECGVSKFGLLLNCRPEAAKSLADAVDFNTDEVELLVDPTGEAGRTFGVERGWRPDDTEMSPFLKLFAMLWGLGAWATLPAVIGGYLGNPFWAQPWIEDALAVGQRQGRWPGNALEIASDGTITNKFAELPLVGEWKRRPLELATLRLQNMLGVSLSKWKELAPDDEALKAGVLTQLGACVVVDSTTGEELFKWRDPGICAVANFEDILSELKKPSDTKPAPKVSAKQAEEEMVAVVNQPVVETEVSSIESDSIDLSIPYDAAARLAYDASDKSLDYAEFKIKYEADAVAEVKAKKEASITS